MSTTDTRPDCEAEAMTATEHPHQWNDDGEKCTRCGASDWMAGGCTAPPVTEQSELPPLPKKLSRVYLDDSYTSQQMREYARAHETHLMQSYAPLMDAASAKHRIEKLEATIAELRLQSAIVDCRLPEGWKLVPVNPTAEMSTAGKRTLKGAADSFERQQAISVFKSMVAAAPLPAAPVQQEGDHA